jgi:hypothetical protein
MSRFEILLLSGIQLLVDQRRWQREQTLLLLQPPHQNHLFFTLVGDIVLHIHGLVLGALFVESITTFSGRENFSEN